VVADSVLVDTEKNFVRFGLGFSLSDVITGLAFATFWPSSPGRGRQDREAFFWIKFVLETRLRSASSEPLIDFLAYLEPKLWHKIQKLVKISTLTNITLGVLHPYFIWP